MAFCVSLSVVSQGDSPACRVLVLHSLWPGHSLLCGYSAFRSSVHLLCFWVISTSWLMRTVLL